MWRDNLIGIAQACRSQDISIVNHDHVVQNADKNKIMGAHHFQFVNKAASARAREYDDVEFEAEINFKAGEMRL